MAYNNLITIRNHVYKLADEMIHIIEKVVITFVESYKNTLQIKIFLLFALFIPI